MWLCIKEQTQPYLMSYYLPPWVYDSLCSKKLSFAIDRYFYTIRAATLVFQPKSHLPDIYNIFCAFCAHFMSVDKK